MCLMRYDRMLQWRECDPAGIIFFPRYAEWMTEGLDMMLLGIGYNPNGKRADGGVLGLPSVGYSSKFHAAPHLHDWVTHELEVTKVGSKSLTVRHRFTGADGTLFAEAEETRVFVVQTGGGMQSVPVPEEIRAKLESGDVVACPAPGPASRT